MLKVGNKVRVRSFMLESAWNHKGEDTGVVQHIETQTIHLGWLPPVTVKLDNGDADGHKFMRFNFEEVSVWKE